MTDDKRQMVKETTFNEKFFKKEVPGKLSPFFFFFIHLFA